MKREQIGRERTGDTPAKTALHNKERSAVGGREGPLEGRERDRADLERFRAAAARLTARQKGEVIRRMLEKPDTP